MLQPPTYSPLLLRLANRRGTVHRFTCRLLSRISCRSFDSATGSIRTVPPIVNEKNPRKRHSPVADSQDEEYPLETHVLGGDFLVCIRLRFFLPSHVNGAGGRHILDGIACCSRLRTLRGKINQFRERISIRPTSTHFLANHGIADPLGRGEGLILERELYLRIDLIDDRHLRNFI